ncbi:Keratocan [Triplophysa tibetana]|uniref:Keratocan n=1 Tax=Triplophysa tibetana TaxID=1572043 RepID=A0A5A9PGH5_9TELE|nr:Keratocan [Triplophysa tibetana]
MKAHALLFWIFAVPAHTIVLQPNLDVSVLHYVPAESDLFGELRINLSSFNTKEERHNEEVTDRLTATIQLKSDGENNMMNMKIEETGSDVTQRPNQDEQETSDPIHKDNKAVQITDEPVLSALNSTYTQTAEFVEHLVPFAQSVNHYTTPPPYTAASQSAPIDSVHAIPQPSFPSISRNPATTASTSVIADPASVSETTAVIPKHDIPTTAIDTLLINASHTSDDVIVELHVMNNSKLHLLGGASINSTAVAARAGPIAKALPSVLKVKPKNKTTGTRPKGNKLKTKSKKLKKKEGGKENKTKPLRKGNKVRKEKKFKATTDSHFPYFEDHYCPPECSCYGRVVQCSDKHLDKIPYGIPYNSRYILLMNNRIDSVQSNLLSLYESMEFLVLSNNHLMDAAIEGAFEGLQSLKRLYMERNLLRSVPSNLPAPLEELRMDGNQLSRISGAAMSLCPNLLILSLSNNSLGNNSSVIPPGVLLPLGKLRTLTLSNNLLTSVPMQLPLSLRELYLRGNLIQRLQGDIFWGEAELQVLDLSANRLTNKGLGKASLLNATRLESLNLEGNLLKQVPRHLPRTIKTLNLEGNFISSISKDAFISLPQLEHLGLARNKITKVAVGAFWVLPLLHQLDVSHNALRQVPRQLPRWLHSVTLAHNKIRTVPRDAFCWGLVDGSPLSRLVRVQLEHNMIDLGHLDTQAFRCLRGFQVVQFY